MNTKNTDDTHGGYRLAKVTRMQTRGGIGFSADLTLQGKTIAFVVQSGTGGSAVIRFDDSAERVKFDAYAVAVHPDAVEPVEDFVWRLESVDVMNRKRRVLYVIDGDDFWKDGRHRVVRPHGGNVKDPKVIRAAALDYLRNAEGGRNPKVWDKAAGDFLPLDAAA